MQIVAFWDEMPHSVRARPPYQCFAQSWATHSKTFNISWTFMDDKANPGKHGVRQRNVRFNLGCGILLCVFLSQWQPVYRLLLPDCISRSPM